MCTLRCATLALAAIVALGSAAQASAQVGDTTWIRYPGWRSADHVKPALSAKAAYDSTTRLWRYEYVLKNLPGAEQDLISLHLVFNGFATAAAAPAGWEAARFSPHIALDPGVIFHATPDEDFQYRVGPSAYQIHPGAQLSGFVIQSPYPPGYARSRARGFAAVRVLPDTLDPANYELPDDTLDTRRSWAIAPTRFLRVVAGGNRRPAVDGFLGFMNLATTGSIVRDPAPIALKFSLSGETVYRETLHVVLNGVDVTVDFHPGPRDGADLVGLFTLRQSPLRVGKNILETRVDGLTADGQRATDADRITFTVNPTQEVMTQSLLNLPYPERAPLRETR